jgi:membrane protease YdiL (CAAX protease family)
MVRASQSFPQNSPLGLAPAPGNRNSNSSPRNHAWLLIQVIVAYAMIEAALWTPAGKLDITWMAAAALSIICFMRVGGFSDREMGLTVPPAKGSAWIILSGAVLAALIPLLSMLLGTNAGLTHALPLHAAWRYGLWSLVQQFILESFLYVRLEAVFGSAWAVVLTATLFAIAHIPSPVLMVLGFFGGLYFCEMFRRYRNIFPLGLVHAIFGLTIAASFSDHVLHHMRVGVGYLMFHP